MLIQLLHTLIEKKIWLIRLLRRAVVCKWHFNNLCEAIFRVKSLETSVANNSASSCKQQSFSGLQSPRWSFSNQGLLLLGSKHFLTIITSLETDITAIPWQVDIKQERKKPHCTSAPHRKAWVFLARQIPGTNEAKVNEGREDKRLMVYYGRSQAKVTEERSLKLGTRLSGVWDVLHNKIIIVIFLCEKIMAKKKKETINEMIRHCFTFTPSSLAFQYNTELCIQSR